MADYQKTSLIVGLGTREVKLRGRSTEGENGECGSCQAAGAKAMTIY